MKVFKESDPLPGGVPPPFVEREYGINERQYSLRRQIKYINNWGLGKIRGLCPRGSHRTACAIYVCIKHVTRV